jgi:hypothetical protein
LKAQAQARARDVSPARLLEVVEFVRTTGNDGASKRQVRDALRGDSRSLDQALYNAVTEGRLELRATEGSTPWKRYFATGEPPHAQVQQDELPMDEEDY